jgi:hypothetical protein
MACCDKREVGIYFVNKKAALFNKRPEELIGKSLWSIFRRIKNAIPQSVLQSNENKKDNY